MNAETSPRRGRLIVISAPSGAGKTSLVRALLEADPRLRFSVSCTTRPPREGEIDGDAYHFLQRDDFVARVAAGEFLEHAEVFGNLYGTRRGDVSTQLAAGHDLILEIDWQGAAQVRAAMPAALTVFVLPPSLAELERRLRGRGSDPEAVIQRRLSEAQAEISHWQDFAHVVVNDDFDHALAALQALIDPEAAPPEHTDHSALVAELLA